MAIFLPGSDTPACGGKRGSAVFQNTANGRVMRANVKSNQKLTSKWQKSKANMLAAVSNWQQLNATEQSEWDSLAATLPQVDACGITYYLSGQQLYNKGGKNRADQNQALPTTAPVAIDLPGLSINSIELNLSTETFEADITPFNVPDGNMFYYYATPPMSPGISTPPAASFIYLLNADEGDETDINLWLQYIAAVGPLDSQEDQAVFLKIIEADQASGISGTPIIAKTTIAV